MSAPRLLAWLSCFPEKLELYAEDPHFLAGWQTIEAMARDGEIETDALWGLGSVLFKAECVLTGRLIDGLRLLEQSGLSICAARDVGFGPLSVRDFWRYSLGRLSEERIDLLGRLLGQARCLYTLVTMADSGEGLPVALRVTELKGSVSPAERQPHHLRLAMGRPQTAVLNFIHTGDEPADIVRELGLLFHEGERRALLRAAVARDGRAAAFALGQRILDKSPRCDLDLAGALARLRRAVMATAPASIADAIDEVLDRLARGERGLWPEARRLLEEAEIVVGDLDQIVIEGWTVPLQKDDRTQPFPSCERSHWTKRER